jgi:Phosphopantetheine attachment site
VPAAIVVLDALPLTRNGKIDRAALPPPEYVRDATARPPRGDLEQHVAECWRRVLPSIEPGVHDNFFDVGGDSLLLTRVFADLQTTWRDLRLVDLFRYTTIASLAAHLGEQTPAAVPELAQSQARARQRLAVRRRASR